MEIFKNRPLALAACSMAFFAILSAKLPFYPKLLLWFFLFLGNKTQHIEVDYTKNATYSVRLWQENTTHLVWRARNG